MSFASDIKELEEVEKKAFGAMKEDFETHLDNFKKHLKDPNRKPCLEEFINELGANWIAHIIVGYEQFTLEEWETGKQWDFYHP